MSKRTELVLVLLLDFMTLNGAFAAFFWFRIRSGLFTFAIEPEFILPMIAIYIFWLIVFGLFGLYRSWYAQSRLDEMFTLVRATLVGVLVLFFIVFMDEGSADPETSTRWLILGYWLLIFGSVTSGRMAVRFLQKSLLESGIGSRNTIIVGFTKKAQELADMVLTYPALGYHPKGFVVVREDQSQKKKSTDYRDIPVLGKVRQLPALIRDNGIKEVLIGLDSTEHSQLLEIIRYCNGYDVGMKIIPDLYDIVSGQARVSSIYGFPLMEVMPEVMKPWESAMKRFVDIVVALLILALGLPVWLLVAFAIRLDSRGPIFYRQERVGRNGSIFNMLKFRSMVADAEQKSGPVWAEKNDPRVTRIGKIIRRMHLDEVPQFINVLVGDMSLVGPRPERPHFVEKLSKQIPLYRRRLRVRPGITGWAQVKYKYDQSVEDVKTKVKYDLFYIENMSWRMDMKILFNTLYVMLRGKGHA
ncbi:MAG: sugar transferase [Proteobacteria bacterium]|nr:sugar transferase [Pseudomonadota bacterium]